MRSTLARTARMSTWRLSIRISPPAVIAISRLPVSLVGAPTLAEGRLMLRPNSLVKTAVMMKKISRFITKSSIGARSMPVVSPGRLRLWRRIRISELERVGEELGLPARARFEVEDRIEAGDADCQAGQGADHRVGDAVRHRARVRRAAEGHRVEDLEHAADRADQPEQRSQGDQHLHQPLLRRHPGAEARDHCLADLAGAPRLVVRARVPARERLRELA